MVTGAYGDALIVEDGSDVVRVHFFQNEAEDARLLSRGSNDPDPLDRAYPLGRVGQQLVLPLGDLVETQLGHVFESRTKPDHLGDHRSSGLELCWQWRPG